MCIRDRFDTAVPGADQIYDVAIAVGVALMRQLCGPQWNPRKVLLPRHRPGDVRPYEEGLGCSPDFAADRAVLIFPAGNLRRRIAFADHEMYALLSERLKTGDRQSDLDFADQVRRVVRGLVAVRRCTLDEVAAMSVSYTHLDVYKRQM